jgi:hypothetical protein
MRRTSEKTLLDPREHARNSTVVATDPVSADADLDDGAAFLPLPRG